MSKGYWGAVLAIGLMALGGSAEANHKHHHRPSSENGNNPPSPSALIIHESNGDVKSADDPKGCKGTSEPDKTCDAISANAAVQQARDADWQAIAGGLGVLIGGGTLAAAIYAACWAKKAAIYTKISARHARRSANAAIDQIELTREEFVTSHRPKIIIRNVSTTDFSEGNIASIGFQIINVGETDAILQRVEAEITILIPGRRIPQHMGMRAARTFVYPSIVEPGVIYQGWQEMQSILYSNDVQRLRDGSGILCIIGIVEYTDSNGILRRTGFARSLDTKDIGNVWFGFKTMDSEEYEYSY